MAEVVVPPKECPVCFNTRLVLKSLPCGHEFCLECLETHRKGRATFLCPNCRKNTDLRTLFEGKTAEILSDNYYGFLKCHKSDCGMLKRVDRIRWCVECHMYLCLHCAELDSHFLLSHTIKEFNSLDGIKAACAKMLKEEESERDTVKQTALSFCQNLYHTLLKELTLENMVSLLSCDNKVLIQNPLMAALKSTFNLNDEIQSGGLSKEETQRITNEVLNMMGVPIPTRVETKALPEFLFADTDSVLTLLQSCSPDALKKGHGNRTASPSQETEKLFEKDGNFWPAEAKRNFSLPETGADCASHSQKRNWSLAGEYSVGPVLRGTKSQYIQRDRFLIHGGSYRHTQLEIFHPTSDEPSVVQSFQQRRENHTATRLPDGSILVAGGYDGHFLSSCELLDPLNFEATPTAPLPSKRSMHSAESVKDRVYFCGGYGYGGDARLRSVVRYVDGVWEEAAPMITGRVSFALATNTQALYAFGGNIESDYTAKCERFDEGRGKWNKIMSMPGGVRMGLRAVFGNDGRFWICGGYDDDGSLTRTEMYDPKSGQWMAGPDLNKGRGSHGLLKTSDGRIWALGGGLNDKTGVEVLDPRQPVWQLWEKKLQLECNRSAVVRI